MSEDRASHVAAVASAQRRLITKQKRETLDRLSSEKRVKNAPARYTILRTKSFLSDPDEEVIPIRAMFPSEDEEVRYVSHLQTLAQLKVEHPLNTSEFQQSYAHVKSKTSVRDMTEGEAELVGLILLDMNENPHALDEDASTDDDDEDETPMKLQDRFQQQTRRDEPRVAEREKAIARQLQRHAKAKAEVPDLEDEKLSSLLQLYLDANEVDPAAVSIKPYFVTTEDKNETRFKRHLRRIIQSKYLNLLVSALMRDARLDQSTADVKRGVKEGIARGFVTTFDDALTYVTQMFSERANGVYRRNLILDNVVEEEEEDDDLQAGVQQLQRAQTLEAEIKRGMFTDAFLTDTASSPMVVAVKEGMVTSFVDRVSETVPQTRNNILLWIRQGIVVNAITNADTAVTYLRQHASSSPAIVKPSTPSRVWIELLDDGTIGNPSYADTFRDDGSDDRTYAVKQSLVARYVQDLLRQTNRNMTRGKVLQVVRAGIAADQIEDQESALTYLQTARSADDNMAAQRLVRVYDWIEPVYADDARIRHHKDTLQKRFYTVSDQKQLLKDALGRPATNRRQRDDQRPPQREVTQTAPYRDAIANMGTLPFTLRLDQKLAAADCLSAEGRLVVAPTGYGKSRIIMTIAAQLSWQNIPVLLVLRRATMRAFRQLLADFSDAGTPLTTVTMVTHEHLATLGKNHIDYNNGTLKLDADHPTFKSLRKLFPAQQKTAVLVDECQQFAESTFRFDQEGLPKPISPYVSMVLFATLASRVYLFTATPCNEYPSELKSLLFLVKKRLPPAIQDLERDFNAKKLTDYMFSEDHHVQSTLLQVAENVSESAITYNWRCLVSYYQLDQTTQQYRDNWAEVVHRSHFIPMMPEELARYEAIERDGIVKTNKDGTTASVRRGWTGFGAGVRRACEENKSKTRAFLDILDYELHRFDHVPQIKPRIMVYTYTTRYNAELIHAIQQDSRFRGTQPFYLQPSALNEPDALEAFKSKDGPGNIVFVTKSGITGYDPPPLTSIVMMNVFWSPTELTQLEGRLNRYQQHNYMNNLPVEKKLHVHTIVSTKAENETEAIVDDNEVLAEIEGYQNSDDRIKPYSYDTRQLKVEEVKRSLLAFGAYELYCASPQFLPEKSCEPSKISRKYKSDIVYLDV